MSKAGSATLDDFADEPTGTDSPTVGESLETTTHHAHTRYAANDEPGVEDGVDDLDRRLEDDPEIATDGKTDVRNPCRDNSRLEIDDPEHCKQCGAELPDVDEKDAQGRPLVWTKGQWESLEICADCWTDQELEKLRGSAWTDTSASVPRCCGMSKSSNYSDNTELSVENYLCRRRSDFSGDILLKSTIPSNFFNNRNTIQTPTASTHNKTNAPTKMATISASAAIDSKSSDLVIV
ncbi:hypothetical protein [Halostagnicola kamekurae]|uniref:Uncharacterized protein n=1 Tax=Halostagnicola kamekurae TaxID=619731 RepID=A0A1I6UY67_9EURY|nr:hypothetical protein [Halostagnicola kamekurae]SFT06333.1 hypothetical protein SAMN04488556_4166 [Halostagnicola kamekurae]